jgi:Tfp pilus assembly protein PilF
MAAALLKQKKYVEVLPFLERAYALDSKYIKVVFNLFVVHARLKNREPAKNYLKQALALDRDYTVKRLKKQKVSDEQIEDLEEYLKEH